MGALLMASKSFKLGDQVEWTSRGGARTKAKAGTIEVVIPAGQHLESEQAKEADAYGLPRDHESYLVRVGRTANRKGKLYWPRVGDLDLVAEKKGDGDGAPGQSKAEQ